MSYLSQATSKLEYGVVKVGDYIDVLDGVISLKQDLSPDASVEFTQVTVDGVQVITSVTPTAGAGISITNLMTEDNEVSFEVSNSGVLSLSAGPGISLSAATGSITVSATGADLIRTHGTTTSYMATYDDEYIGVNSTGAVTITLPTGVEGRVYYIKDEHGQGSGKITIQPQAGEKIDNGTNYIISVPYQCVSVVFRAGGWWLI